MCSNYQFLDTRRSPKKCGEGWCTGAPFIWLMWMLLSHSNVPFVAILLLGGGLSSCGSCLLPK